MERSYVRYTHTQPIEHIAHSIRSQAMHTRISVAIMPWNCECKNNDSNWRPDTWAKEIARDRERKICVCLCVRCTQFMCRRKLYEGSVEIIRCSQSHRPWANAKATYTSTHVQSEWQTKCREWTTTNERQKKLNKSRKKRLSQLQTFYLFLRRRNVISHVKSFETEMKSFQLVPAVRCSNVRRSTDRQQHTST